MKVKILIPDFTKALTGMIFATGFFLTSKAVAQSAPPPAPEVQSHNVTATDGGPAGTGANSLPRGTGLSRNIIQIESIAPDQERESAREVAWLGISTEEVSEALASQLGLKPGQGLVVVFVAPDSPAFKAGIQKYDVIEELGDQMLVDPTQLRKLVQMQNAGDIIKLVLYRGGKKQTKSATLSKRAESLSLFSAEPGTGLAGLWQNKSKSSNWVFENYKAPIAYAGFDKQMINAEVQSSMEDARKAIQEALSQSAQAGHPLWRVAADTPPMPPLVNLGNNSTVTVTKDGTSMKTIVKSDETGVLVLVANPKKHLTAHDQNGKLLFDGDIENSDQQQKVPPALWEKVKPLLEQIKPTEDESPEPHAQSGHGQKLETKFETKTDVAVFV